MSGGAAIKRNYGIDLEALYKQVHQEQQEAFAVFAGHFLSNISCAHSAKQIMTSLQEIFRRVGYNWKFHELPLPSITPIHQLLHALKTKECTADYAQKTIDDGACLFLSHGIPLRKAIKYSAAPAVLETLIHAGASVHQLYEGKDNKYTPLHYAAACNNREAINVLCTHGADPNMPNNRKETPLFICCRHSRNKDLTDEEKVKRALTAVALLEHTADANYKNRNGDTPLHIVAIKKQNVRLAKVLLAGGANVNAQSNSDNYANALLFLSWDSSGHCKDINSSGC